MVHDKSHKDETAYAFIDSQNLNLGVRSLGWELDFHKFRLYLKNKYNVKVAFLFIGYIPTNTKLYGKLKAFGYRIIFKPTRELKIAGKKLTKGNVDAELVLHCMLQYQNYDKAIIVSGDGDFFCLVEYLDSKSKLKRIVTPNSKYSSLLRRFQKYIFPLSRVKSVLEKKATKIGVRSKP